MQLGSSSLVRELFSNHNRLGRIVQLQLYNICCTFSDAHYQLLLPFNVTCTIPIAPLQVLNLSCQFAIDPFICPMQCQLPKHRWQSANYLTLSFNPPNVNSQIANDQPHNKIPNICYQLFKLAYCTWNIQFLLSSLKCPISIGHTSYPTSIVEYISQFQVPTINSPISTIPQQQQQEYQNQYQ